MHTVNDVDNKLIRAMLVDLGYVEYESYPGWAYELCERLIYFGWKKKINEKT